MEKKKLRVDKEFSNILLSELIPYERNNKKHGENIKRIADSIKRNEYITPIIVDENNIILAGHGRKLALEMLGEEEAEVLKIVGLTDKQKADFRIADNRTTELSERDFDAVMKEIAEFGLEELKQDFPDLDFGENELDEENEDSVPEVDEEPIVQLGDMFKLGEHTLMCGDSMDEDYVKLLLHGLNSNTTHCISDPPYGIAYDPDKHGMILNDDKILDYTGLAKKYTNGFFCMRTGYQVVDQWKQIVERTFGKINNFIIWHKGGGGMGDCERTLAQDFEILLVSNRNNYIQSGRGGATRYRNQEEKDAFISKAKLDELRTVVREITKGQSIRKVSKDGNTTYLHPTQKPVEINDRVLVNFTTPYDNVLDLFGGSGSNLLSCEKNNRKCYMMELDPKYIQVILKRYYDYTKGQKEIKCLTRDLDLSPILNG